MTRVYVASPFGGDEENLELARDLCRIAEGYGLIPFAPHLYFSQFMDEVDPDSRSRAIEHGKAWLGLCEIAAFYIEDGMSPGMGEEIEECERIGLAATSARSLTEWAGVCAGIAEGLHG